jgi:GMP synthase (glutamine-hydrolysing)
VKKNPRFLILDGYPGESREQFQKVGVTLAGELYAQLLLRHLASATYDLIYLSDAGAPVPTDDDLKTKYDGILWPGCNLTIYHDQDQRVTQMIAIAKSGYQLGIPQFGSCWGAQMAAFAAGGKVAAHPKGREMGIGRNLRQTLPASDHPMYQGKPEFFSGFMSHDDEIIELPKGAVWLAKNDHARFQALAVKHQNGEFWATQYHCEYNLYEMARLILARESKLIAQGFFKSKENLIQYAQKLEALHQEPTRKDLRWQLAIGDDIIEPEIRECEFRNWIRHFF